MNPIPSSHLISPFTAKVVWAPQMILQPVFPPFLPVLYSLLGLAELQARPFPDVVFPQLPLSALSSPPFHCALQDGFGKICSDVKMADCHVAEQKECARNVNSAKKTSTPCVQQKDEKSAVPDNSELSPSLLPSPFLRVPSPFLRVFKRIIKQAVYIHMFSVMSN